MTGRHRQGAQARQRDDWDFDAYVWLANRLPRVKRRTGDKVSWAALQAQFGADMKDHKKFRCDYLKAFRQALAV